MKYFSCNLAFAWLALATNVALVSAAPAKKPAPKPAAKSAPPQLIREVLGTQQLRGYEGKLGQTFTVGKATAVNFTLNRAEYSTGRLNIGQYSHLPLGDEKFLVLHFTVQNPLKDAYNFTPTYLIFNAVDANGVTRPALTDIARKTTGESASLQLKPGQKIELYTAIRVAGWGEVPKLIVQNGYDHEAPIVRYDLRGKIAKLAAPLAPNGLDALKIVPAQRGTAYPITPQFDVSLDQIAYSSAPMRGYAPEAGRRYCIASVTITNRALVPARYGASLAVERAFFDYFLELAKQAAAQMQGPQGTTWLARLDAENDNLRAALGWARENDGARGLELSTSLLDFWATRLSVEEGRDWIETFLGATQRAQTPSRVLAGAGILAWYDSDLENARALMEQGIATAKATQDEAAFVVAAAAFVRLVITTGNDNEIGQARQWSEQALSQARASGDDALRLEALIARGWIGSYALLPGETQAMHAVHSEAVALARALGDDQQLAAALNSWSYLAYCDANLEQARALAEESAQICRGWNAPFTVFGALWAVSIAAREQGQLDAARDALRELLQLCRDKAALGWIASYAVLASAYLLMRCGDAVGAAQLMSAALKMCERVGYRLVPMARPEFERYQAQARAQLGADFEAAWRAGQTLSLQAAIERAAHLLSVVQESAA